MKTFLKILKPKAEILKYFLSVLALIFIFLFFYDQARLKAGQRVTVSFHPGAARGLAAYENSQTASVSYPEFSNPQTLFDKAQVIENENKTSIQFVVGNILVSDENGNKNFACQRFSNVNLLFEADGLFIEGEKVLMKIEGSCLAHKDHQFIGPFSIPVEKILQTPPAGENVFKENKETVKFFNVSLSWPKNWTLVSAQFKNSNSGETLGILKEFKKNSTQQRLFSVEF